MFVKLGVTLLMFFLASGCDSKSGSQNAVQANSPGTTPTPASVANANIATAPGPVASPSVGPTSRAGSLDACGLIEKPEIESVQGGKVQGTVPSRRDGDGLAISQCYYTIFSSDGSKNLSVHLEVMQNDPKSPNQNAVGDLWKNFQGAKGTKKTEKPKSVPGVGDEAFWVGNEKAGAVYVLKKGKVVRVSIGGPDDVGTKIEKSKALVAKVLKRLS